MASINQHLTNINRLFASNFRRCAVCMQIQQRRTAFIFPQGTPTPGFRKTIGSPPGVGQSLEQLIARKRAQLYDPELDNPVNIGLPPLLAEKYSRRMERERRQLMKSKQFDEKLEQQARHRTLVIPLDEVDRAWHAAASGPAELVDIANHYGIFRTLFGSAFFYPRVMMNIGYAAPRLSTTLSPNTADATSDGGDDDVIPVKRGNIIMPAEAQTQPFVELDLRNFSQKSRLGSSEEAYRRSHWSLMLLSLDGHTTDTTKEYIHWFVANIPPDGNIAAGEERVPYMQPLPLRGTGMNRYCFMLYKHTGASEGNSLRFDDIFSHNTSSTSNKFPENDLPARSLSTLDFYQHYQDRVTPAGLAFFVTEWDQTVRDFFYDKMDAKEPVYEYQHREMYVNPHQEKYGSYLHGFNLYLDRYRNKQDMAEEMVKKRLKSITPFAADPPRPKYPNALYWNWMSVPSWKCTELDKERLGWVKYRLLYNPLARWP